MKTLTRQEKVDIAGAALIVLVVVITLVFGIAPRLTSAEPCREAVEAAEELLRLNDQFTANGNVMIEALAVDDMDTVAQNYPEAVYLQEQMEDHEYWEKADRCLG